MVRSLFNTALVHWTLTRPSSSISRQTPADTSIALFRDLRNSHRPSSALQHEVSANREHPYVDVPGPVLGTRLQLYCADRAVPEPAFGTRLQLYCANRAVHVPELAPAFGHTRTASNALCKSRCSGARACFGHTASNLLWGRPRHSEACVWHTASNWLCKPRCTGSELGPAFGTCTRLGMYCANRAVRSSGHAELEPAAALGTCTRSLK